MKRNLLLLIALLVILISACNQAPEMAADIQTTDSLSQAWTDLWNSADVDGITGLFTKDAVVITDTALISQDAIKTGFILPAAPILSNLICQKLNEAISGEMAYQSGSYKHDWVKNDTLIGKAAGYYTLVWKKQEDKSWKVVAFQTN